MAQTENITKPRKGKHLNFKKRSKIEAWKELHPPLSNREIAKRLNQSPQTIHSEVKDGNVRQIRRQFQHGETYEYESFCYSATVGQETYEIAHRKSRRQPK